jgi:hypothetical protein
MRTLYRLVMPSLPASGKQDWFSVISALIIVGLGLGVVMLGTALLGPLGALLGLAIVLGGGARSLSERRF